MNARAPHTCAAALARQSRARSFSRAAPSAFRARLQEVYYERTLYDLMLLQYDHASPRLASLDATPEWTAAPNAALVADYYARPLAHLPTSACAGTLPTTHLLHRETVALVASDARERRVRARRPLPANPVDYSVVSRVAARDAVAAREAARLAAEILPYAPLPSRLPVLEKVTVRVWSKKAMENKYVTLSAVMALSALTGVRAQPLFSDVSDAQLGVKKGQVCGAHAVLTEAAMFNFCDTLVQVVMPRLREWAGVNPVGSGDGSLALALDAHAMAVFPGIEPIMDSLPQLFDFEVVFSTTARSDAETIALLSSFQIPFLPEPVVVHAADEEDSDPWAKFRRKRDVKGKGRKGSSRR